ncbi:MAG TPA: hypothetical protein VHV10_15530 [Ktedonobacteraceae bacterium]|nr:hypothetical protein [Ktedonobacteraceae bacterium]
MNETDRRGRYYVACAGCGCDVLKRDAIDIGLDPVTQEQVYLCEECEEEEEEEE